MIGNFEQIPDSLLRAPAYLRESIRQFFEHVTRGAPDKWDAPARTLLLRYCEVWNQIEDVKVEREEKKIGFYFRDKHGQPRIHPLAKHEMQLTNELGKLFRLLGWDLASPDQMELFKAPKF